MKTSNKLVIVALVLLIVLPAASFYTNRIAGRAYLTGILAAVDSLQSDSITVVQYRSPKATPGLLYVTPARSTQRNAIILNVQPQARIAGDTLIITSTDNSAIYQGSIRLRNLRKAIFNETVRTFPTATKVNADSLRRDSIAIDTTSVKIPSLIVKK